MKLIKYRSLPVVLMAILLAACSDSDDEPVVPDPDEPDKKITNTDDEYYDWNVADSRQVVDGVKYTCYSFTRFSERVHVVEVDLNDPKLTVEVSMADDLAPNPNANDRHNNGPCLRETLRENIQRKRSEGRNIVAGINTGFFDSHVGIPRGIHVEKGEMVYLNNPDVRNRLGNHVWGIAFFNDRSVAFDERKAEGHVRVAGKEYEFFSVNDTVVALRGKVKYDANVYTHRLVAQPHPGIYNEVSPDALFIVAKGNGCITVNTGYQEAVVTDIIDGRNTDVEVPYVDNKGEWVLQVTGSKADMIASSLKKGDKIEIETVVKIGEKSAPLDAYNAGMFYYVRNGEYVAPPQSYAETIYQTMNIGTDISGKRLFLFCIDGVRDYRGLDFYEASRVAKKLGVADVVRFDGGGSTTMWVLDGKGGDVVNNITDSKGERSCMNYLHIRRLD